MEAADLLNETPNTRSKRLIEEQERRCGIFQRDDGTWDIGFDSAQANPASKAQGPAPICQPETETYLLSQTGAAAPQASITGTSHYVRDGSLSIDGNVSDKSEAGATEIVQPIPNSNATKARLWHNLERVAQSMEPRPGKGDKDTGVLLPLPGPNGARGTLQKNLDRLAGLESVPEIAHLPGIEANGANDSTSLPPGFLDVAQLARQQNMDWLAKLELSLQRDPLYPHHAAATVLSAVPQNCSKSENVQSFLLLNPDTASEKATTH